MITNKITAYGFTVAVAFAAAVVLLLASAPSSANADAGTTADVSVTITDIAPTNVVTIKATQVSGIEACEEGTFNVSAATNGTLGAVTDNPCTTRTTTISTAGLTTDTTIAVAATAGFPTSGSLLIDNDGDNSTATGALEVVNYTGVTTTSFTGVTRAQAGTTALALLANADIWPATFTQVTVLPYANGNTTLNVASGAGLVAGGTVPPELVVDPAGANQEIVTVTAKSGNTLTTSAAVIVANHPVGEFVVQITGANPDSATVPFTPSTDATEGSFKYSLTADGQTSTLGTSSLTIISGKPNAAASEVTVSSTSPTPVPVLIQLVGTDLAENNAAANQAFTLATLPTKGVLGTISTPICSAVTTIVIGEVVSTCTSQVVYTPLLGASGTDSFTYVYVNGVTPDTSAAATVTIVLPGGSTTPTPGAGFSPAIVAGFNLTTYNGGTLAELATDAAASGATTVSVTVGGNFLIHVVGAPAFVNAAFAANFADGTVPAGTTVLVVAAS